MISSIILALREGLEAALIVGILIGALRKFELTRLRGWVWAGVASAVLVSLAAAGLLSGIGASFEGAAEQIFEGTMMLTAALLLTWMIFWMKRQAVSLRKNLEDNVRKSALSRNGWALFLVAFTAVVREGIELAIFLLAVRYATTPLQTLSGALIGLGLAIGLGWLLFTATIRLNLSKFFQFSNIILLLFAAGLVAHGVHEFNEAGWIPALIEHVYDINWLLPEKSPLGLILTALLGYNGNPSLSEMILYLVYLGGLGLTVLPWRRVMAAQAESGR